MAAIIGTEETSIKRTGTSTSVPDHDVCRLSYYLACGTVFCGVDILVDELVDYKNAHRLPKHRQDAIFRLAYDEFDLETLGNTTIFLDDDYVLLPRGYNNVFLEVEKASNILAVQSNVVIAGKQTQVRTIMVCNRTWLESFYVEPLQRNRSRLSTTTSPVDLLEALVEALSVSDKESKHCEHCRGLEGGMCACKEGCVAKAESMCKVVHDGISCDACGSQSIQGPRFKCKDCWNFDLCEKCYRDGRHAKTHPFSRIARVGSTPVHLEPRERSDKAIEPIGQIFAMATPIDSSDSSVSSVISEGQTGRLVGLSDASKNGQSAVVIRELADGRVLVRLPECNNDKISVKKANLEIASSSITVGRLVELTGLSTEALNGKLAEVVSYKSGRVQVKFLDENRTVSVKAENLQVLDEVN